MKKLIPCLILLMNILCLAAQKDSNDVAQIMAKLELNDSYPEFLLETDTFLIAKLNDAPWIEQSSRNHVFEKDTLMNLWRKLYNPNHHCCFGPGTCDVWNLDLVKMTKGNSVPIYVYKDVKAKGEYKIDFLKNSYKNEKHIRVKVNIDFCTNDTIYYQIERSNGYQSKIKAISTVYNKVNISHYWELPKDRDTTLYWEKITLLDLNGKEKVIQYVLPFSDEEDSFGMQKDKENELIIVPQISHLIKGMKMSGYFEGSILQNEMDKKAKIGLAKVNCDYGLPLGNIPYLYPTYLVLGLEGFLNKEWFSL